MYSSFQYLQILFVVMVVLMSFVVLAIALAFWNFAKLCGAKERPSVLYIKE
jgi:hypothetical protein